MKFRVTVPATAGTAGEAFDELGLALEIRDEIVVDTDRPGALAVEGEGGPDLVREALARFEQSTGTKLPPHGLRIVHRIPRGLGGSAATVVGGLLAADALTNAGLSRMQLLRIAVPLEGHAGNAAAAIYGGAVLAVRDEGRLDGPLTVVPLRIPSGWKATLLTSSGRHASSIALLVAAILQDRPELLKGVSLHPQMDLRIGSALEAGRVMDFASTGAKVEPLT